MAGYVKLFSSILDSTVWETPLPTKVVWITMLAMSDRDGEVSASVPGLAKRAGVDRLECERALALLLAPDPDSRTKDYDGRRLEVIDGGWRVLNYEAYRDRASADEKRAKDAERQRRKYDRDHGKTSRDLTRPHTESREVTPDHEASPLRSISISPAKASSDPEEMEMAASPPARAVRSAKPKSWRRFPADYEPGETERSLAAELCLDIVHELGAIRDHEFARPKSDPAATLRTWLRNSAKYSPVSRGSKDLRRPQARLLTHAEHAADAAKQVLPDWARD